MANNSTNTARLLRKRPTDVERLLWRHLRSKQVEGLKFRRQQPIGRYVVDFVCFERRTVIEVDGGQHAIDKDKDERRDQWLREQGFKVLRFWNGDVLANTNGVLEVIRRHCLKHPPPTPPIKGGAEKADVD